MSIIEFNPNFGDQTQLLAPFVALIIILWSLFLIYSYKRFGTKRTLIYFLPIIIVTFFIESAGVAGGRYYYPGYFIYISVVGGAVPISIAIAWSVNFFLFMNIGKHIVARFYDKKNRLQIFFISLFAGVSGVLLDLLEDPIAQHNHWWVWQGDLGGLKFYDVPLINFLGWFFLLFFMSFATILIERSRFSDNRKVLLAIASLAITGSVIFLVHGSFVRLLEFTGLA
jgi:bisanhydrobacterioruberin hydratase